MIDGTRLMLEAFPDRLLLGDDVMALDCMNAARYQLRPKVPQDVSIVGFDGVAPTRWQSYDLTTVQQPVSRMADASVSMIMEKTDNPKLPPEKRTFSSILLDGSSAQLRKA